MSARRPDWEGKAMETFAAFVWERGNFTCARCGWAADRMYASQRSRIAVLRMVPSKNHKVMFDADNAVATCFSCQDQLNKDSYEREELFRRRLGEDRFLALMARAEDRKRTRISFEREAIFWKKKTRELRKSVRDTLRVRTPT